jgi:hypothetical protein
MTTLARERIGWGSWAWIAWRQHRTSILLATGVTIFVGYCVGTSAFGFATDIWPYVPTALSTAFAAFWAAPMVAREFEDGTNRFAWSQDASPARWVAGRALPLFVVATVLVGILNVALLAQLDGKVFTSELFEANPFLHTTYVLFGFALGLAFSTLLRQTPGAIGGTLVAFLAVRVIIAMFVRMHLVPTQRDFTSYESASPVTTEAPFGAYIVDSGYTDLHGVHIAVPAVQSDECAVALVPSRCLYNGGVGGHFTEYQPIQVITVIQLMEGLIFVGLAGLLLLYVRTRLLARRRI